MQFQGKFAFTEPGNFIDRNIIQELQHSVADWMLNDHVNWRTASPQL